MAMTTCKECEKPVSTKAKTCPHCGTSTPAKKKKGGVGKWLLIFFAIGLAAVMLSKKDMATNTASTPLKSSTVPVALPVASAPPKTPAVPTPSVEALTEGQQKAMDGMKEVQAMLDKASADARKWDAATEADAKLLRACIEHKICESGTYTRILREKSRTFVEDILGRAESVQSIGGSETDYYTVPTVDGRKSARLQLSYKRFTVDNVNVY